MPSGTPGAVPGPARRLVFGLIVLAGLGLAGETLAWLALVAIEGGRSPVSAVRAERDAAAGGRRPGAPERERPAAAAAPGYEVLHPYLGFVMDRPGVARRGIAVNEYGLFGPDPVGKRGPDRVIVAILGGSLAMFLIDDDTLPVLVEELQRAPRFRGKRVVVLNLALGGYKQPQEGAATMTYLLAAGAEFDVAINVDGFNEVALHPAENAAGGVSPLFPRSWALRVQDVPGLEARRRVGEIAFLDRLRQRWAGAAAGWPWRTSTMAALAWKVGDRQLERRAFDARRRLQADTPGARSFEATGPVRSSADQDRMYEDLADLWQRGSRLLAQLCAANGIHYYHFLQPNQYVPGAKVLTADERRIAYADDSPYKEAVERGYPLLIRAGRRLAAEGVRFDDLTRIFAATRETVYADACCHLNAAGRTMLVRRIAGAVVAAERD